VREPSGPGGEAARERASTEGRRYMTASMPRSAAMHLLDSGDGRHLLVADGSRLFDIDAAAFARLDDAVEHGAGDAAIVALGLSGPPAIGDAPLAPPPVHALSLAVAQKCNLGCVYCYAQQGAFGGAPKDMKLATAERAVELLLSEAATGSGRANLAFLGGEPLVNRAVVQETTRRAAELALRRGVTLGFSITTNGTLVSAADAEFFEAYGFAVTATMVPVKDHDAGVAALDQGAADAYASDRVILIGIGRTSKNPEKLTLVDEFFSYEPYGLMLRRGDAAFRLSVNRALASLYRSGDIAPIFEKWFGSVTTAGQLIGAMYFMNALPE